MRSPEFWILAISIVHASLVVDQIQRNSPTWHEPANILSSLRQLEEGNFSTYRVNGAAPRWVIGVAVKVSGLVESVSFRSHQGERTEFASGSSYFSAIGADALSITRTARMVLMPFSVAGIFVCYFFGRHLYGTEAGLLAATLWALSPTVLSYGSVALSDMSAAVIGAAAAYLFCLWSNRPSWQFALGIGILIGIGIACKTTLLIAIPLLLVSCIIVTTSDAERRRDRRLHIALMMVTLIFTLNILYCFDGSGRALGSYNFISLALKGDSVVAITDRGNRFSSTLLATLPILLPQHFILGLDEQQFDFEQGMWGFLNGQWSKNGWLHYYVYSASFKEPIVILLLAVLRTATMFRRGSSATTASEMIVLVLLVVLLGIVSIQTGINRHYRYLLPAIPFFYIWISGLLQKWSPPLMNLFLLGFSTLILSIETFTVHPHELSFFNALAGGPKQGHRHLLGSNLDWSQDILELKQWMEGHPGAIVEAHLDTSYDPVALGLLPSRTALPECSNRWIAISANRLFDRSASWAELVDRSPDGWAGYSIRLFRVNEGSDFSNLRMKEDFK